MMPQHVESAMMPLLSMENINKKPKDSAPETDMIFVDRRKELVDRRESTGGIGYISCRRQLKDRRRCKYIYDVREWWLRVNYVEHEAES